MQSKVQVSPNSDPQYQGYVARWYTYYNHDPYFSKFTVKKAHITGILFELSVTFTFLNLFIPIFFITKGKQIVQRLIKITEESNQRVYRAMVFTVVLFNVIYIVSTVTLHIQGYPKVLNCLRSTCVIPQTATSFNYVVGLFITKAVILPNALLIELMVALYIARGSLAVNLVETQGLCFQ